MEYNLLFLWLVDLGMDDPVWGEGRTDFSPERAEPRAERQTVFSKNRDRLLATEMSREVTATILAYQDFAHLLSDEHFSVDGTLVKGEPPRAPPVQAGGERRR